MLIDVGHVILNDFNKFLKIGLVEIPCENNNWVTNDRSVVLKYLHNSQDNIDEFLREVELLLRMIMRVSE
ncbi:unnamed protein product [Rhizophagus irregularis]|nr:unnamed protein product [Rhizophagus irregularis]